MRYFYIPACLLAAIVAFSLWTGHRVEQQTEHLNGMLEEIRESAREEDWEQAEERLEDVYASWSGSQTFFHIVMAHDELDEAENLFAGAFAVCREAENADFQMLLAQLAEQLSLLAETQSLSIKNVL